MNVLVVEDNLGDIELLKMQLKRSALDWNVLAVHDGDEGLKFLKKEGVFSDTQEPDIILLDLNMPRMDGKEFLRHVKNDVKFKTIPVIMLTSSDSPKDIKDCYEHHVNSYVLKTSDMQETIKNIDLFWRKTALKTKS